MTTRQKTGGRRAGTPNKATSDAQMAIAAFIDGKRFCGAHARSTGRPCLAKALRNGRCRNHGGLATGPKTPEGKRAIAMSTSQRMASGQQEKALKGFYAWLDNGGRQTLSRFAVARERRKRTHRAGVGASRSLKAA